MTLAKNMSIPRLIVSSNINLKIQLANAFKYTLIISGRIIAVTLLLTIANIII